MTSSLHLSFWFLGRITQSEYDKKATELKRRQHEIDVYFKEHTKADENFGITLSYLLDLTCKAKEVFESSKVDQKRRLLSLVLSNLKLNKGKLIYKLNTPFDAIVAANKNKEWLPRLEAIGRCFTSGEAGYFPYHVVNGHIDEIGVRAAK